MKVVLIVGGVVFLLLAVALFIGAIVTFLMARRRGARPAAQPPLHPVPRPVPPPVPHAAPHPVPQPAHSGASPPPAPQPPLYTPPPAPPARPAAAAAGAADLDGTVMIDSRRQRPSGALHATSGSLAGRVFPIDPSGFYIGRDRTQSQVVVDSPSVSKRHVWIGVRDGAVVAVDQQSTNGTYLNSRDAPITEATLKPGDTLILSDDVARFAYNV